MVKCPFIYIYENYHREWWKFGVDPEFEGDFAEIYREFVEILAIRKEWWPFSFPRVVNFNGSFYLV